jgi:hypothetical protein
MLVIPLPQVDWTYYARAHVPFDPRPTTYAELLKDAKAAALGVQRSDHWTPVEEDETTFPGATADCWAGKRQKLREKQAHMAKAGATAEERKLATTPSATVGKGDCPVSMCAARPTLPSLPISPAACALSCHRAPRPSFPIAAWRAEHHRRCSCTSGRRGPSEDSCQFQHLMVALEQGWEVPMAYDPLPSFNPNYPSALERPEVIVNFIKGLLAKGRLRALPKGARAIIEMAMGVVYRLADVLELKPRVTVDATASGTNACQPLWSFRYLTVASFVRRLLPGAWMFSLDLKILLLHAAHPPPLPAFLRGEVR